MLSKTLVKLIFILFTASVCFCQVANIKQPYKTQSQNLYISPSDTFNLVTNFELHDHSNGLPEGNIEQVVQTDDGYVWLSIWNYGLVRYDGYHFKSFTPLTSDSGNIPAQYISQISKSSKGGLWLVTDKGLIWFDLKTYKSRIIPNLPKPFLNLGASCNIVEDQLGQLWLFGMGLYLYRPSINSFEKITKGIDESNSKPVDISGFFFEGNRFNNLTLSPDGSFWLGGSALAHIDPKSKKISCYHWNKRHYNILLPDPNKSYIWLSGFGGLSRFNYKENSWLDFKFTNDSTTNYPKGYYEAYFIQNDKLWITNNNSILILDTTNFKIQIIENDQLENLPVNTIKGINSIQWIYNEHQLFSNSLESKKFIYQKILPKNERVLSYFKDKNKEVEWFGTLSESTDRGGFYKHDLKTNKVTSFILPVQPCKPFCLNSIDDHTLIIGVGGTLKQPGKLLLFDIQTSSFKTFTAPLVNHPSLTTDSLEYLGVCRDEENNLWFSVYDTGLVKYEVAKGKFYLIRPNKKDPPSTGHVSLSNTSSSFCFKNRFDSIKGLPSFSTALVDSNNNIIGLANDGLFLYNVTTKTNRRFNALDGFKEIYSDYSLNTLNQPDKNELLISDFYRFPIKSLYPSTQVPPISVTNIKVLGKELKGVGNVNSLDTLKLRYDQNQLTFEFVALSFLSHEVNNYACKLQELDTAWQQLGSNNSITYASLNPGKYDFKVKTANRDGIWGKEKTLHIEITPAFWQTVWFKILTGLAISGFLYWLFRNHLYKLNLKNQFEKEKLVQQKKEAEFQKKLGDLTLSALRSQINPHFIFNCLNSIKLYTAQHDVDTATEYLTKFSRLIRQVLNNCKNEKILLSEELEVLQLYIEMEAMRFKDKLQYTVTIEDNVETDYIDVPPLLLQPYVENAIWHGLMNKEEGGHLEIHVKLYKESTLLITIKDDGIGRAKAAELKNKTLQQHKSFGMQITSERLNLIKELYKTETTVAISDLTDENNLPAGTLVTIQIQI